MIIILKDWMGFMTLKEIISHFFGLIGLVIIVSSFQCKKNRNFFLLQAVGSCMFFVNFIMINAYAGALFNLTNFVRGIMFSKEDKKLWKLVLIIALYTLCYTFSVMLIWGDWFMIFIASLADSLSNPTKSYSFSLFFVRPTGTIATLETAGYNSP